ncbi:MAG: pilus assembly protein PilM, partial [Planctomycetota bacterium]
ALVALTKNPFLESLFRKIQRLRLHPTGATPNSIALFRCFIRQGSFDSNETLLLVDIGKNNTDICLCQQSKLLFARNLSHGAALLTQAIQEQLGLPEAEAERLKIQESSLLPGSSENKANDAIRYGAGQLLSSIKSSLTFAKQQLKSPQLKVDRVCLSGGGGQQKGLPEYLSKGLGIPVIRFDPAVEIDLSLCSEAGKSLITSAPLEWAVPLGILEASTDETGFSLKLLPKIYEKRSQFLEGPFFLYLTVLFTISYLAVHILSTQRQYDILTRQKQKLLSQRNLLEELKESFKNSEENTRQYQGKLALFQDAILPGTHFFKVITKLNAKIPSNIWIKSVAIKEESQTQKKIIE